MIYAIHLHSFICSAAIMQDETPSLNQLIATISFDSHFNNINFSLSFVNIYKNDIKKALFFSLQLG